MAVPVSDLQQIAPSAVIELFQLELNAAQHGVNETYYFHAGVNATGSTCGDIIWNGQAYLAFPIEATEFEYTGTGSLPRPKLRISNIYGTITALILSLPNGLEGAKVTRIRTLARYIDGVNFPGGTNPLGTPDPTAEFPREIYYIDRKASENRDLIEFELAAAFDLVGVRAPKRQCVSNVCQWTYRGAECGYAGNAYFNFNDVPVAAIGQDVCGKRLRSCELRFSQQRFAGTVTVGSNIITLGQSVSFSTGDPVSGFGLPGGTTVSSVAGNLVTVSQNSTASTYVTTTGTIQSNYTQIVLSSAAGIIPGMAVFGNYLPANTQVVGVSGNTVTLSSPVALEQFFTTAWTRTSAAARYRRERNKVYFADLSTPITVGQFISSSVLPLSRKAVITGVFNVFFGSAKVGLSRYKIAAISQEAASNASVVWTAYTGGAIPAATYNFVSTNGNYTFRANASIPYGSYPGVGAFFT
jgi:lambda family phage minor tail protein L